MERYDVVEEVMDHRTKLLVEGYYYVIMCSSRSLSRNGGVTQTWNSGEDEGDGGGGGWRAEGGR